MAVVFFLFRHAVLLLVESPLFLLLKVLFAVHCWRGIFFLKYSVPVTILFVKAEEGAGGARPLVHTDHNYTYLPCKREESIDLKLVSSSTSDQDYNATILWP